MRGYSHRYSNRKINEANLHNIVTFNKNSHEK